MICYQLVSQRIDKLIVSARATGFFNTQYVTVARSRLIEKEKEKEHKC